MSTVPKYFIQTLEDGSVTAQKLAAESVITSKIKDANVTPSKLAEGVDWDLSGSTLTVATPTLPGHAATKAYVDGEVAKVGLHWKEACRIATDASLTGHGLAFAYDSGTQTWSATAYGAFMLEGVSLQVDDRLLVKDETGPNQPFNGIFKVIQVGSPSLYCQLQRTEDCDSTANMVPGFSVFINEGTNNADTVWGLTTDGPITPDVTALTFTQQAHISELNAGDGLTKVGNTIDVGAGDGIQADPNSVTVLIDGNSLIKSGTGLKAQLHDGLVETANGIAVDLATAPGLEFDGGGKLLVDVAQGIEITADGVAADLGSGLQFDANDQIELDTTAIGAALTGGDGVDITGNTIAVDLSTTPGLEFDGSSQLKAKAGQGIEVVAGGIAADLGSGLQFDGSDQIELDTTAVGSALTGGSGIDITGNTVSVDLASSNPGLSTSGGVLAALAGDGIELTASGIAADLGSGLQFDGTGQIELNASSIPSSLTAGDGIDITGSTVSVDLAASNPGLEFASAELKLKGRIEPREMGLAAGSAGASDVCLTLVNHPASPTVDSAADLLWTGVNGSNAVKTSLKVGSMLTDITAGSEQAKTVFEGTANGSAVQHMAFAGVGSVGVTAFGPAPTVANTNTVVIDDNSTGTGISDALRIQRRHGGTPAAGDGTSLNVQLENGAGSLIDAQQIICNWTDPAGGSETSNIEFKVMENGAGTVPMKIRGGHVGFGGGVSVNRVLVNSTAPFNVGLTMYLIACDTVASGGNITLNLPMANSVPEGTTFLIKDEEGNANINNILVKTTVGDSLDSLAGPATLTLLNSWVSIHVYSNGSNAWHIF